LDGGRKDARMSTTSTTIPGVDVARLTRWLGDQPLALVPPFTFTRIGAGQSNLTYRLSDAEGASVVLRRPPLGEILASAHDMGREHTVLRALSGAGARVPRPLAFCEDADVCGAPFYLMEHVDGLVLSSVATAEILDAPARTRTAEGMAETLAALHALDVDEIGLEALRRPESLGARQLRRWTKQWHASKTRELPLVDEVGELLAARLPEEREQSLVHGDYHLGNTLVTSDGQIAAVLDWELCTVGDPLADVGLMVAYWGETAAAAHESDVLFPEPVTALPGFPNEVELAASYVRASGRDPSELGYWVAFAYWKVAIIVEGVYRRWLNDPTNGTDAGRLGTAVPRLARLAAEAADASGRWSEIGSSRSGR
jgi:aminoglycoside phosphotransferase (APT) family kinase protein